jgi:Putative secretion activating protein
MADFSRAFERMIQNEGGYRLVNVPADRGGETYAGIARNFHPNWPGWRLIDNQQMENLELSKLVRDFYRTQFWEKIAGDQIRDQVVAESIFDFSVNAGLVMGVKLAQITIGALPDGRIGPVTLAKLNEMDPAIFVLKYALAKIARYAEICNKNRDQSKFLLGWVNRTMKELV